MYGLKQALRQWYLKFEFVIEKQEYKKTFSNHCAFFEKFSDDDFTTYVDDMLIVGKTKSRIVILKKKLSKSFAMKDLGPPRKILGIQIHRDRDKEELSLSQQYIVKILKRFNMTETKVVSTPLAKHFKLSTIQSLSTNEEKQEMSSIPYSSAVDSLMYAMVCTRPDIAHAVSTVSKLLALLANFFLILERNIGML